MNALLKTSLSLLNRCNPCVFKSACGSGEHYGYCKCPCDTNPPSWSRHCTQVCWQWKGGHWQPVCPTRACYICANYGIEELSKYASVHAGQHAGHPASNALMPGKMSKDKIELREAPHYGFLGASVGSAMASSGATTKPPLRDSSAAWDYGLHARMELDKERSERAARRASSVGSLSARLLTLEARHTDTLKPLTQNAIH